MSLGQAIWIGACQILSAVFPGTSRSMSTIAAGQLAGMSRASALEFSFFLSIPTMVVATGYDLLKSLRGKGANPIGVSQIDSHGWLCWRLASLCHLWSRTPRLHGLWHGCGSTALFRSRFTGLCWEFWCWYSRRS